MYEGGDGKKIAKLFPAYLMNPANCETFHPRNFCRYKYDSGKGVFEQVHV